MGILASAGLGETFDVGLENGHLEVGEVRRGDEVVERRVRYQIADVFTYGTVANERRVR